MKKLFLLLFALCFTTPSFATYNIGGYNISARVWQSGAQSLPSGTAISYNSVTYETGANIWDVANPTRLTAPVSGVYIVTADVAAESDSAGSRTFRVNGTTAAHNANAPRFWTGSGSTTALIHMNAGDYVECVVFLASTVNSIADSGRGYFAITLINED